MKRFVLLIFVCLISCSFKTGAAQEISIESGRTLLKAGSYKEAITVFAALLEKDSNNREAQEGLLSARIVTGDYETAERDAKEFLKASSNPALRVALGQILFETGRYKEAFAEFERASQTAKDTVWLRARLGQARALRAQGKEEEARPLLAEFIRYYNDRSPRSAEELTLIARAIIYLEKYKDANDLFIDARETDPAYLDAYIGQGELLNEKYNYGEAASLFVDALKINTNLPAAHLGMAESKRLTSTSEPLAAVGQALAVNPNHVGALVFRAWLELEADKRDEASKTLDRALEVNPNSVEAIAVRAAIFYLSDRKGEFDAEVNRAMAVNPRAGELFETLAHFATINRRYHDAVKFGREAVKLSPKLWSASTELGIQLLRIGRVAEGRTELERTFAGDPFNVWAKNTLDLLDSMNDYSEVVRGPFIIKASPKESDTFSIYAAELLEEAHKKLAAKYRFTPTAPITVEAFPNHEDFAVRALGLPGLGALGVCFGQVIAMDGPSARSAGEYNWGETLWHEFVHVMTIQMTDYRIPRWFSEGLSVYEEGRAHRSWGDNWSLETLKAYGDGRFVKIDDLDAAFTRPRSPDQVPLAYFQASQVCEFIEEKYGFDRILQMLALYKEGAKTPDVLQRVLSLAPADFDKAFDEYLKAKTKGYLEAIGNGPVKSADGQGPTKEAMMAIVKARPNDYFAHLRLGAIYKSEGDMDRAIEHLRRASELFPFYTGQGNPYLQMADIYQSRGQKAEAATALAGLVRYDENDSEALKRLAGLRLEMGDRDGALEAAFASFYINPFDTALHKLAGDAYLEKGDRAAAVREFRVRLALKPPDLAEAHYDLARSLDALGNRAEARREVLRALEIAPGFDKAQELLLKLRGSS